MSEGIVFRVAPWLLSLPIALALSIWVRSALVGELIRDTALERLLSAHLAFLRQELRFVRVKCDARLPLGFELGVLALSCLVALFFHPLWLLAMGASLSVSLHLRRMRQRRVRAIEKQVGPWLGALSRALVAAPSLGEAMRASATASPEPLRDEVEMVLKENQLGLSLDRALQAWTKRVNSRVLNLAVATLLVGRQTGGNLSQVLQTAAESLREMDRLEGVLRTKTAEGRVQAFVISVLPAPLYGVINLVDPQYFSPLWQDPVGHLLISLAVFLWVLAVLVARKILSVRM